MPSTRRVWLLWLALLLAYFAVLGCRPLCMPDEVRYAEISREMLDSGDWVVPRLLRLPYFEKPVGGYWLINTSQLVFGHGNFAVRFPSALASAITALLVGALARSGTGDPRKGWLAGLVYLSSFMVFGVGTDCVLDPMLTMWLTAALGAFWRAFQTTTRGARWSWWSVFGALCGAAFLTKGFVALAVPTVAITPLMLWQRRWRELLGYGAWSVVVATAVAAPWALSVHAREPDYWRYFFWEEHVRRFASHDAQHPQPFWYFLPFALAMTLPWTGAVPAALRFGWRHGVRAGGPFERLMLLAVLAPLLFFSLAEGKLATYILPCFPPFAILIGNAIVDGLDRGRSLALQWSARLMLGLSSAGLLALLGLVVFDPSHPDVAGQTGPLVAVGLLLVMWIGMLARTLRRGTGHVAALALLTPSLAVAMQFTWTHPQVTSRMPQDYVREVVARLPADYALVSSSVKLSPLLSWESGRALVVLVGGSGEFTYGLGYPEGRNRHFGFNTFPAWLAAERRERPVVLFVQDSVADRPERFPAPDRIEHSGSMAVLYYDRRVG
jgi:4-amino-4-deoxy-L-arabinose transferase